MKCALKDRYKYTMSIRSSHFLQYDKISEEQNGDEWSRSEDLVWLRPDTDYELQVKARNTLGWGSLARSYVTLRTPPNNDTNSKPVQLLHVVSEFKGTDRMSFAKKMV